MLEILEARLRGSLYTPPGVKTSSKFHVLWGLVPSRKADVWALSGRGTRGTCGTRTLSAPLVEVSVLSDWRRSANIPSNAYLSPPYAAAYAGAKSGTPTSRWCRAQSACSGVGMYGRGPAVVVAMLGGCIGLGSGAWERLRLRRRSSGILPLENRRCSIIRA